MLNHALDCTLALCSLASACLKDLHRGLCGPFLAADSPQSSAASTAHLGMSTGTQEAKPPTSSSLSAAELVDRYAPSSLANSQPASTEEATKPPAKLDQVGICLPEQHWTPTLSSSDLSVCTWSTFQYMICI